MYVPKDSTAWNGLRARWASPPRSGLQRIIAPWEYRHLRFWGRARIGAGTVLAGLGIVTLVGGSFTTAAVGFAIVFFAGAVASFACAAWDLAIARSAAART